MIKPADKNLLSYFSSNAFVALLVLTTTFFISCQDVDPNTQTNTSENVPGLTTFQFLAKNNENLYQDITFEKQPDNSYQATVVHEVSLEKIKPSFDYKGNVVMNAQVVLNEQTELAFPDEFVMQFDGKNVIFHVNRHYTIPTLYIHTEDQKGITSKEEYIKCSLHLDGKNMYEDFLTSEADSAEIRGRGNSTWLYYDKKPYRLKLDKKSELLGMGEGKSWVLLANYRDPTNFMNAVAFDMARYMELPYTNSNRFVEVYLDDDYIGMYQLTEQVQQGKNRVEIDEDAGVLLSLDLDDGPYYAPNTGDNFYSKVYKLPVAVKYPEDQSPEAINAIKEDFAQLEQLIKNRNWDALSTRLDIQSMIDFLIIQEMTRNVELVSPRSMYLFKDADQVYHFGPVWDFDGGFAFDWASMTTGHGYFGSQSWLMGSRNPSTHPSDDYNYIPDFFVNMFGNSNFLAAYKARWAQLNPGMLNHCYTQLDDYILHCDAAMANNAQRWPIGKDYTTEIKKLKTWLSTRASSYSNVIGNY